MVFFRQEYWSKLPCPPPGDLHKPEIEPVSLLSPALAGRFFFFFLPGDVYVLNGFGWGAGEMWRLYENQPCSGCLYFIQHKYQ